MEEEGGGRMRWTPHRLVVVVVLAVALLVGVAYGAAALWDWHNQSEKEYWERLGNGTFFRR